MENKKRLRSPMLFRAFDRRKTNNLTKLIRPSIRIKMAASVLTANGSIAGGSHIGLRKTRSSLPFIFENESQEEESSSYTNLLSSTARPTPLEFAGRFKLVVLGENESGKTCLLNAFSRRTSTVDTAVTYDDGVSTIRYGSKQVEFVIWDLSGCSDYDGLRIELYRDTDLFIVCYDIGNTESLEAASENWIPEILLEEPNAPFILVGCKYDLRNETMLPSSPELNEIIKSTIKTSVSKLKAEQVAREWGAKDYIECCAKTNYNISEVFKSAAQVLLNTHEEKNNLYGFKALSMFRRRKSSDTSEIFYSSYESSSFQTNKFYPTYTKNYLRRDSETST